MENQCRKSPGRGASGFLFYLEGEDSTSKVGDQSNNSFSVGAQAPSEINDAHACGMEDVALQATRTRRSGSLCEH